MEVRLLGRLDVLVDGASRPLGGHRQRAVLAVLAVHANEVLSVDRLADEVWGGSPPPSAHGTLQRYVSHLRHALRGAPIAIESKRPGYLLGVAPDDIDVCRFERLVREGRGLLLGGSPDIAAVRLHEALALWRGEPLADFADEPFAQLESLRLQELRWTALELRIDADLALGRHRQVVAELDALVAAHPLRESFRGQLMRALHGAGRRADALRVYGEGRRLLAEQLGLDPSSELQRLETAILLQDPTVDPPAPRRALTAARRLPDELTSFVGRATEVEAVHSLLARVRMVTLTGVGGSGKSRLALRAAAVRDQRLLPDAWFVELSTVSDGGMVARAAAAAVGVRDDPTRDAEDALVETLASIGPCLLVFDGCEHLLDAVVPLVERLLAEAQAVRIVATSREVLGVAGETVLWVPTLPVPRPDCPPTLEAVVAFDAARLFVERATAADAGFRPHDADAGAVAALCARLDGLPLALELAAARMDVLTPRELLARLAPLDVLRSPRRSVLPRHRTLRATIEWSYDLLRPHERVLFERLSVFAASFDVATVERVCAGGEIEQADAFELLVGLVRKSLVVRVDSGGSATRYRLLDTLREYSAARLRERGAEAEARRRHAAHYTEVVEQAAPFMRGPGCERVLDELEHHQAEFRAALAWLLHDDVEAACRLAAAVALLWDARFRLRAGRYWLGRTAEAAAAAGAPPSPAVLWTTVHAAYFAFMDSDLARAEHHCAVVERLLEAVPDERARTRLLLVRAEVARHRDDLDGAARLIGLAAAEAARLGDPVLVCDAERLNALVAADRGDFDAAIRHARHGLGVGRSMSDIERAAGAQGLLGSFLRERGYLDEATRLLEESLGGFQQVGEPLGMAFMLWQLAGLAVMRGDPEGAVPLAEHALRINEDVGFSRGTGQSCLALADAELARGRLADADRWCDNALARFAERRFAADTILGLETAACIRQALDDLDGAFDRADRAVRAAREHGYEGLMGRVLCLVAGVHERLGDAEAAGAAAAEAHALAEHARNPRATARACTALAGAAFAAGRRRDASGHLRAARHALAASGAALTDREQREYDRVHAALSAPPG